MRFEDAAEEGSVGGVDCAADSDCWVDPERSVWCFGTRGVRTWWAISHGGWACVAEIMT